MKMITIDFDKKGHMGLCDFLCHSIRRQIESNELEVGEHMPSKRALSEHLNVSIITVQNAYNRLIEEGYLYSMEKKGYFVTDIAKTWGKKCSSQIKKTKGSEKIGEGASEFFADFTNNATSRDKFPFTLWTRLMRQVLNSQEANLLAKTNVHGALELRRAIAKYLAGFRNMDVDESQIVIGAGTESLYSMLVQFLGSSGIYAVENPGYHTVASVFSLCGAECQPVEIDECGIKVKKLKEKKARIVHVSPLHHFPTGIVMSYQRRQELLLWANGAKNRYIIEDDYDSEFRFNGKPLPTLQSVDKNGHVIYINTFSKTLSPSFRISYMVLPKRLVEDFDKKMLSFSCPVSSFEQYTLARFISDGYFEKHITKMKNYYRNLRNELIFALNSSPLASLASIREENSGLHFLLGVKTRTGIRELKKRFLEQKINIQRLDDFYYGTVEKKQGDEILFLVNYSSIKKSDVGEIVRRLEKIFLA